MSIPRPEYPRPQFVRKQWMNLNGEWQFEIDHGDTGLERGLMERELAKCITVPFCPESALSGIGETDFMRAVWYRRQVAIPPEWKGNRVLLHFQAVDYDATVWVNGIEVRRHRGGFTPFQCDLSGIATPGETAVIVVRARDYPNEPKPIGKQSQQFGNYHCFYTRTTGIWQTVWMEPVSSTYLLRPHITPDVANGRFHLEQRLAHAQAGLRVRATLYDDTGEVAADSAVTGTDFCARLVLPVADEKRHLWSPEDPFLYQIRIELLDSDGAVIDSADSYGGLRGVGIDGKAVCINGKPVFQRLVLDQGYYPDGVLTAPSDDALIKDIELSLAAGFNGARLHEKVFEERFLYHADRMGYLVWGEFPDWGCRDQGRIQDNQRPTPTYITQWLEAIERDYSHPCIIGWCPLNETLQPLQDGITVLDDMTRGMFLAVKAHDGTRPVLDASGYSHRVPETDVYDCHDYEQNPVEFGKHHASIENNAPFYNEYYGTISLPYGGQPFFVSEFGGIWWNPARAADEDSWGYGEPPSTIEEYYERFNALCMALLNNPAMFGYCYTQLTDVHQEENGVYTFDRKPKFDMSRIASSQQRKAAIEKDMKA